MQCGTPHPHAHLGYQQQDSAQTLAEGLQEYYSANVGTVTRPDDMSPDSAALFRSHDIVHVIFGLDTSLSDEVIADTRGVLASDVGFRRYLDYVRTNAEAQAIFKELGYAKSIWVTVVGLPRILRAARKSWHMTKRWPWEPPDNFLARPLGDLRREFGICIV